MSARPRTEAQKAAAKRKCAENPDANKKASRKWKEHNPDKRQTYREAHPEYQCAAYARVIIP